MRIQNKSIIVFAGDSTTDADKMSTPDALGTGYVRLVHGALTAFRPAEEFKVINAGINGNKSADLLARWDRDVASRHPDVIFCMIGINDVWRHFDNLEPSEELVSPQAYRKNLEAICEKSKSVRQFIFMLPFFMEANRTDAMRMLTEEYANVMKAVAAKYGRPVLDTQAVFDEYMQSRHGQSICWDRVHPCQIGAMLLARMVLREIEVW